MMQARAGCPPAVASAVQRIQIIAAYLVNGGRDTWSHAELARLAHLVHVEAVNGGLDELKYLADHVAAIAEGGVATHRTVAELHAAVQRLAATCGET